jgi:hypothetical protein
MIDKLPARTKLVEDWYPFCPELAVSFVDYHRNANNFSIEK